MREDEDYTGYIMEVINTAIAAVQSNKDDRLERTSMEVFTEFNEKLLWISRQKGAANILKNDNQEI